MQNTSERISKFDNYTYSDITKTTFKEYKIFSWSERKYFESRYSHLIGNKIRKWNAKIEQEMLAREAEEETIDNAGTITDRINGRVYRWNPKRNCYI